MSPQNLTQNPQNPSGSGAGFGFEYFEDDSRRVETLMAELSGLGVVLRIDGDRLAFDAPAGVLVGDLLARVRADRAGLVAMLSRAVDPPAASSRPKVVHLKREPFDLRIDRGSRWGNPFVIGPDGDRAEVIAKYRAWIVGRADLMAALPELRGKRLGCWCAPLACHGDVLADLVVALDDPPAVDPAPSDRAPSIRCPCGGVDLFDDPGGLRCRSCRSMAWVATAEGGLVRRDVADEGIELVDPDSVPICPGCGRWCDVRTLAEAWRCSRCDPEADDRRRLTSKLLGSVSRSLGRCVRGVGGGS